MSSAFPAVNSLPVVYDQRLLRLLVLWFKMHCLHFHSIYGFISPSSPLPLWSLGGLFFLFHMSGNGNWLGDIFTTQKRPHTYQSLQSHLELVVLPKDTRLVITSSLPCRCTLLVSCPIRSCEQKIGFIHLLLQALYRYNYFASEAFIFYLLQCANRTSKLPFLRQ